MDSTADESLYGSLPNSESQQIIAHSFFKNLLTGHVYSTDELRKCLQMINLSEDIIHYPFLAFTLSLSIRPGNGDFDDDAECSIHEEIERNLTEALMSQRKKYVCYTFKGKNACWNVLVFSLIERELRYMRDSVHRKLCSFDDTSSILTPFNISVETICSLQQLNDLVNPVQLMPLMQQDALPGTDKESEIYRRYLSQYRKVVIELDIGQEDRIIALIQQFKIGLSYCSLHQVRFIMKNLFAAIVQDYQTRNLNISEMTNGRFDQIVLYETDELDQMLFNVQNAFLALCTELHNLEANTPEPLVQSVFRYVQKNLNSEFNCNLLAEIFHVHPRYLGRTFKRITGEKLNDYITRARLEQAVLLLESNKYTVSQVSKMVGYNTPNYFVSSFKQFTGCSPTEYWHQGWL